MTPRADVEAGYSGTPLHRKLGIKEGATVALLDAPEGFEERLQPANAVVVRRSAAKTVPEPPVGRTSGRVGGAGGQAAGTSADEAWDVVLYFVRDRISLSRNFPGLARAAHPGGAVWIAWPKRSSGVATDVTEDVLRDVCLPTGMVDNKVCAIDEIWSGLRFVWRLERRVRSRTCRNVGPGPPSALAGRRLRPGSG